MTSQKRRQIEKHQFIFLVDLVSLVRSDGMSSKIHFHRADIVRGRGSEMSCLVQTKGSTKF